MSAAPKQRDVAYETKQTFAQTLARARSIFQQETGLRWEQVFFGFGFTLLNDEALDKHRAAPYLVRAEDELREERRRRDIGLNNEGYFG